MSTNNFPRLDGNLQKLQLMWQTLYVDMKSLMSWQYLMRDIHIIKTWNITMVTALIKATLGESRSGPSN